MSPYNKSNGQAGERYLITCKVTSQYGLIQLRPQSNDGLTAYTASGNQLIRPQGNPHYPLNYSAEDFVVLRKYDRDDSSIILKTLESMQGRLG